jgi:hypothetical protein
MLSLFVVSQIDIYLKFETTRHFSTRLSDKRDDFSFAIMNFPYIDINKPTASSYGVYNVRENRRGNQVRTIQGNGRFKKKMKIDVDLTKIPRIEPGFYISQFIRYARVCSLYSGLQRRPILSTKLSNHGVLKNRFILSFNGYSKNINAWYSVAWKMVLKIRLWVKIDHC